jgi:hypothetical protein
VIASGRTLHIARSVLIVLAVLSLSLAIRDMFGGRSDFVDQPYDFSYRVFALSRFLIAGLAGWMLCLRRWDRHAQLIGIFLGLSLEFSWWLLPDASPIALLLTCAFLANAAFAVAITTLAVRTAALPFTSSAAARVSTVALWLAITSTSVAPLCLYYVFSVDPRTSAMWFSAFDRLRWLIVFGVCVTIGASATVRALRPDDDERERDLFLAASLSPLLFATCLHALQIVGAGWVKDHERQAEAAKKRPRTRHFRARE